jgi:hypothetical protein
LPVSDVTVIVARSTGRLSGPMMRPRMTSVCAVADTEWSAIAPATDKAAMMLRRKLTAKLGLN